MEPKPRNTEGWAAQDTCHSSAGYDSRRPPSASAAHPAYRQSLDRLREMGVLVGSYEPHRPKAGGGADRFRWEEALDLLTPKLPERP